MVRRIVRSRERRLLVGSVCTGYGGLDAGVMSVTGGELAWTADNDPGASAIIAHRMPGILNLGDIRQVAWENVPPVDIMCGGFPCQPVSAAGKQKGMADDRWLWPDIAQAISRMAARPRLLVFENVPRLLTIEQGAAISQIIGSLAQMGYVGCYGIYSAADAGAAHLRKRWFLAAAYTQGLGRPPWRTSADRDRPGPGDPEAVPDPARTVRRRGRTGEPDRRPAALGQQTDHHHGDSGHPAVPDTQCDGLQGDRAAAGPDQGRPAAPGVGRGPADSSQPAFADSAHELFGTESRGVAQRTSGRQRAGTRTVRRPADRREAAFPDPGSAGLERAIASRAWDHPVGHGQPAHGTAGGSAGDHPEAVPDDVRQRGRRSRQRAEHGGPDADRPEQYGTDPAQAPFGPVDWREYEPAVRRWELVSGYPVPYPVEPGQNGKGRMAAVFPEWLMGLPPGWVTGIPGLSRSSQLRAIGNGVVPHQAALATASLLDILAGMIDP